MKQKSLKIATQTLIVYKSIKTKNNKLARETETTNTGATTTTTSLTC